MSSFVKPLLAMKKLVKIILLLVLAFGLNNSFAQKVDSTKNVKDTAVDKFENPPEFIGGISELYKYLIANIVYPEQSKKAKIKGMVFVSFIVEMDGSISDIKVLKSPKKGEELEKEAIRVVSLMPRWKPGSANGHPVRVKFTIPINFTLD